jgi:hypothetical protein
MIPSPTQEQLEWFDRDADQWLALAGAGDPTKALKCAVQVAAHYKRLWEAERKRVEESPVGELHEIGLAGEGDRKYLASFWLDARGLRGVGNRVHLVPVEKEP